MRVATVSLIAIPLAMLMSSCATTGGGGTASAHVTLEQTRRFHPSFHKLDGEPVSNPRSIRVSPGEHVAELKVRWRGAKSELVSFPMEIPRAGKYVIEIVESPEVGSWIDNVESRRPTVTSNWADAAGSGEGFALLAPLTMAADLGGGAIVAAQEKSRHTPASLQRVWLRLRPLDGKRRGRVLNWKQLDHPSRR